MHVGFTDRFSFPLPEGHRFPLEKYRRLRERLEAELGDDLRFVEPAPVSDAELQTTHTDRYLAQLQSGEIDRQEELRLGLPWSKELVERGRRSCGATLEAARAALTDGVAATLSGGTHHAFADRGEGFCLFNDTVLATRVLRQEGRLERTLVVDLDVHQGNGTARLAAEDADLFTCSIHAERNYPAKKEIGDWDVGLADGAGDDEYLDVLDGLLPEVFDRAEPELVFYVAGADPYLDDRLGRLALTMDGLAVRDRRVLALCESRGIPVVVTLGGGYAKQVNDTVAIQARTVTLGYESWRRGR